MRKSPQNHKPSASLHSHFSPSIVRVFVAVTIIILPVLSVCSSRPSPHVHILHYRHVVSMRCRIFFGKFCRTPKNAPVSGGCVVASDAEPASFFDCHCHFPQLCKFPRVHRNKSAGADGCPAVVFSPQDRSAHPPKLNDELVFRAVAETGCVNPCCTAWHKATGIGKHTVISSKNWFCSRHLCAPG